MGRRQPQRRSPLPHSTSSWQDNNHFTEKRSQQRRKNKSNIPSTKCSSQTSAQGIPAGPVGRVAPSVGERGEVQRPHSRHREHSTARSQHGVTLPPACPLTDPGPDPPESQGPRQDPGKCCPPGGDADSDRDLSDTERLPASPASLASSAVPPELNLRPEVFGPGEVLGARTPSTYPYPDSLPPPFSAWSPGQLACFYHTESRGTPRPRTSDPLQRFLERLLQLEWRRSQTQQQEEEEEGGAGGHASVAARPARHTVRLSCPKSILQCQRAFPLSFLSSPAIDSALLSGCGCSQCRQRYAQAASARSTFSASLLGGGRRCRCPSAHARPGPPAGHVPAHPLPKRSVSEGSAPPLRSTERGAARPRGRLPLSPARGNHNSHLRRMQASGNLRQAPGNLRHPVGSGGPGEETPPAAGGLPKTSARRDGSESVGGYVVAGGRHRSCSEHRGGGGGVGGGVRRGAERYEKRRSGSECHRGGYERTKGPGLVGKQAKPDAVAVMDSLPLNKTKKSKQVEFVT